MQPQQPPVQQSPTPTAPQLPPYDQTPTASPSRSPLVAIAVVLVAAVVLVGGFLVLHKHKTADSSQPVTSFLIENAATPGKSSSDFAQEQLAVGDGARFVVSYNPKLMTQATIRLIHSNGSEGKSSSTASLDSSGHYEAVIDTTGMAADTYRAEVLNQNKQVVSYGELTLTSK